MDGILANGTNPHMNQHPIPFGLLHGRMVEPTEVPRGLACGCVCPECQAPLVARKGQIRREHFAHYTAHSACGGGAETAVHLMAKQILADEKRLLLPGLLITRSGTDGRGKRYEVTETLTEQRKARATRVELERSRHGIGKPDALFHEQDANTILVEFRATNPVDSRKVARVQARDLPMLEINLWAFGRETSTDTEALRHLVLDAPFNREWLSFPGYEAAERRVVKSLDDQIASADGSYREIERRAMAMVQRRPPTAKPSQLYGPGRGSWLVCESCRELFRPPVEVIRARQATVECPHCGFAVSTASSDPRR